MKYDVRILIGACVVIAACVDGGAAISDSEATATSEVTEPSPPPQAASGPGGADYLFASSVTTFHGQTNDDLSYWTIEPRDWRGAGTTPAQVPLVVFLHGWGGNDPI
ncbi:MAG TPA: hypothetical protein VH165_06455 [Kofleriaceae bacterium]|jgi:hypothetical protein|nr:hypothetical protein [Kofleriaceae bacterium]